MVQRSTSYAECRARASITRACLLGQTLNSKASGSRCRMSQRRAAVAKDSLRTKSNARQLISTYFELVCLSLDYYITILAGR